MGDQIKLIVAGDLFPTPINYHLFAEGDKDKLFGERVSEIFASADYSICNLEGCFTDESTPLKVKDGPNIRAPKKCIAAISSLGINCASLANNHATDYGTAGLLDTFSVLDAAGIAYFGAGEKDSSVTTHYSVSLKGRKITFYGVAETDENVPSPTSPGVNIYDEYRVCSELRLLKTQCDYLIVLYHGGIENIHYNTPSIRTRFRRLADNGADIVISQHTHAIGEEEYYKNSYLLYGQGNFCFHFSKKITEWVETALLLELDFDKAGFSVKKHLVRRDGPSIVYDTDQDLSAFYERSLRLSRGETFEAELKQLSNEKILTYLHAFRGKNLFDRVARKVLSKERYTNYLKKQYSEKHILKILLALECEEFREVSSRGLRNMLDELGEINGK